MTLRLANTYGHALETFAPLDAKGCQVAMYSCGPTVYSYAHVGNFRSFLLADVLRRVLERRGYAVRQVMNITDVGHLTEDHLADAEGEDKLTVAARKLGRDPYAIARHYEDAFVADAKALRLAVYQGREADDPAHHPRATEHIAEMLAMIQTLLDRGLAYLDSRGQVYFEVAKFPSYGALSGKVLEELEPGARIAVRDEKKDPRDFALWKADDKHLMRWDPHSPAGWRDEDWARFRAMRPEGVDARIAIGFPGWHIECSAMSNAHLGARIDVHTGGEDNVFPHHECEIAQSCGALGVDVPAPPGARDEGSARPTFARYWVHARHLLFEGRKMSKREGTLFTARELFDPIASGRPELAERLVELGFREGRVTPAVLRYALVSTHYAQPSSFSFDVLVQARASVERLQSRFDRLREICGEGAPSDDVRALCAEAERAFDAALDDDLDVPGALAALLAWVGALNQRELSPGDAASALATFEGFDHVLAVLEREVRSGLVTREAMSARAVVLDEPIGEALDADAIERAIARRHAAKSAKRFELADAIRKELAARGVVLEDTATGVRWKRS